MDVEDPAPDSQRQRASTKTVLTAQQLIQFGRHDVAANLFLRALPILRPDPGKAKRGSFGDLMMLLDLVRAVHPSDPNQTAALRQEALETARASVAATRQHEHNFSVDDHLLALARLATLLAEFQMATERLSVIDEAIDVARSNDRHDRLLQNRMTRVILLVETGNFDTAISEGSQLAEEYEALGLENPKFYEDALQVLTILVSPAFLVGDEQTALSLASRGRKIALDHDVPSVQLIEILVAVAFASGDAETIGHAIEDCLFLYRMTGDSWPPEKAVVALGTIQSAALNIQKLDVVESTARDMLQIMNTSSEPLSNILEPVARTSSNLALGICFGEQGDYTSAALHVNLAVDIVKEAARQAEFNTVIYATWLCTAAVALLESSLTSDELTEATHRAIRLAATVTLERLGSDTRVNPLTRDLLSELSVLVRSLGDSELEQELDSAAKRLPDDPV